MMLHSQSFAYLKPSEEEEPEVLESVRNAYFLSRKLGIKTNLAQLGYTVEADEAKKTIDGIKRPPFRSFPRQCRKLLFAWSRVKKKKISDLVGSHCLKPWFHLMIQTDGAVGTCCIFQNPRVSVCDRTVSDVWWGDYFQDLRKAMSEHHIPPICRDCPPIMGEEDHVLKTLLTEKIF